MKGYLIAKAGDIADRGFFRLCEAERGPSKRVCHQAHFLTAPGNKGDQPDQRERREGRRREESEFCPRCCRQSVQPVKSGYIGDHGADPEGR